MGWGAAPDRPSRRRGGLKEARCSPAWTGAGGRFFLGPALRSGKHGQGGPLVGPETAVNLVTSRVIGRPRRAGPREDGADGWRGSGVGLAGAVGARERHGPDAPGTVQAFTPRRRGRSVAGLRMPFGIPGGGQGRQSSPAPANRAGQFHGFLGRDRDRGACPPRTAWGPSAAVPGKPGSRVRGRRIS